MDQKVPNKIAMTHLDKVLDWVMGDDDSKLAKVTSERDYALHWLEREIAISQQSDRRIEALEAALRKIEPLVLEQSRARMPIRATLVRKDIQMIIRAALDKDADK